MPQQIPALVELLLQRDQLGLLVVAGQLAAPKSLSQLVLGIDQLTDAPEHVTFIDHSGINPLVKTVAAAIGDGTKNWAIS